MAYRTHLQRISAGNQFDGTAPTGAGTAGNGKITFPEEAAGGLFDIAPVEPGHIMGIALYGAAATNLDGGTWTISKVTAEGDEMILFSGTTETQFVSDAAQRIPMLPNEKIKVVTTGMSNGLRCAVSTDFDLPGGAD